MDKYYYLYICMNDLKNSIPDGVSEYADSNEYIPLSAPFWAPNQDRQYVGETYGHNSLGYTAWDHRSAEPNEDCLRFLSSVSDIL
jgi:hypothetical protein